MVRGGCAFLYTYNGDGILNCRMYLQQCLDLAGLTSLHV